MERITPYLVGLSRTSRMERMYILTTQQQAGMTHIKLLSLVVAVIHIYISSVTFRIPIYGTIMPR